MDPITTALCGYEEHLRNGGEPASLARFPREPHKPERLLNASGQCLCDRKAVFDVMADLGEIEPDIPQEPGLALDFRVGGMFEGHIAQALEWAGALREYQTRLSDGKWKGRLDMVVSVRDALWLVEVKTVKSNNGSLLDDKFPKPYHIAQAQWYADHHEGRPIPVLFYVLRATFETRLYTWDWDSPNGNAEIKAWDPVFGSWFHKATLNGVGQAIVESRACQEAWLETGKLPPRCGKTPDEHPFLCVDKDWRKKVATPTCPYFGRCWGVDSFEPFKMGSWE